MSNVKFAVYVVDNGSALLLERTLKNLKNQINQDFAYEVIDLGEFRFSKGKANPLDAEYILYLYSGSRLEKEAVEVIRRAIGNGAPSWLYFDEKLYSTEIIGDTYGTFEKPDFDPVYFAQCIFTGEGVIFSREILEGMTLKYTGGNFEASICEMTIAAASIADGLHIGKCLLTRHERSRLFQDEENLLADALKHYLEARQLHLMGIRQRTGCGLNLFPADKACHSLSVILMSDSEHEADKADFAFLTGREGVEVIYQSGAMSDWEKCLLGAEKAGNELLCFIGADCGIPSWTELQTMLYYAALPYAGVVSPCLYYQDRFVYTGCFSFAGKPITCTNTAENMRRLENNILSVRQTACPAWQFWLVSRTALIQAIQELKDIPWVKALPGSYILMGLAFQLEGKGRRSLYLGNISVRCAPCRSQNNTKWFCEMMLRWKQEFLLDHYCPAEMRSLVQEETEKVTPYFPDYITQLSPSAPRVFVISHELSLTGTPIVLAQAVRIMKEAGWQVVVVSPVDGILKAEFLMAGVPVLIWKDMEKNLDWMRCASGFDLVLVNTVVPFRQIEQLCGSGLPVMWWLHDAKCGYESYLKDVLPENLTENIHVFSVSRYADDVLKQYRPQYRTNLLMYGLKDEAQQPKAAPRLIQSSRKLFVNVGMVVRRKGQDILAQAIRLLPDAVREKCLFLFVGKGIDADKDILEQVLRLEQSYPETVRQIDMVPHDDIFTLYQQADAVICSSRDDPLPTVMAETMMVSGVCICSENTGTAYLIQDGVNGYLYRNDDPAELARCIQLVAECEDQDELRKAARKTYESMFSMNTFRNNLLKSAAECMRQKEGENEVEEEKYSLEQICRQQREEIESRNIQIKDVEEEARLLRIRNQQLQEAVEKHVRRIDDLERWCTHLQRIIDEEAERKKETGENTAACQKSVLSRILCKLKG